MPTKAKSNIKPPQALIDAARVYLETRALEETLRPQVIAIKTKVLTDLGVRYSSKYPEFENALITDPTYYWLMGDEDAARYFPALNEAFRAAGFDIPEGYCPLGMAELARLNAENALLNAAVGFHGRAELSAERLASHQEIRKDALETTLCYVVQFVK
jgi:hypothetical protein